MIYSYDQFIAVIEWINECAYFRKLDEKDKRRANRIAQKENNDGSIYSSN